MLLCWHCCVDIAALRFAVELVLKFSRIEQVPLTILNLIISSIVYKLQIMVAILATNISVYFIIQLYIFRQLFQNLHNGYIL